LLDELTKITGYNRNYASYLLNRVGKKIVIFRNKKKVVFVGDNRKFKKKKRPVIYDNKLVNWLKKRWALLDYP